MKKHIQIKEEQPTQKRVVFLLGPKLIAKLRKASYERNESMSSIVRKAIAKFTSEKEVVVHV